MHTIGPVTQPGTPPSRYVATNLGAQVFTTVNYGTGTARRGGRLGALGQPNQSVRFHLLGNRQ